MNNKHSLKQLKTTFRTLIILSFVIFSCSTSINTAKQKNDVSTLGLNGKVKSIKSELFNLIPEGDTFRIGEKINGISLDRNSFMEFSKNGNIISSKEFLYNGKVIKEEIYTYDEKERLIKRKEISHYGKGSFYDYQFSYDSKDSLKQFIISNDGFKRIHQIERDYRNRAIQLKSFQNDTLIATYIFKYDNNNNIITENKYSTNKRPVKLIERTFNNYNLKEKEQVVEYNTWDTLAYENRFFYDSNQNLIQVKNNYENDSSYLETINTYHKNGKLKKSIVTPIGSTFFSIATEQFNENGQMTEYSRESSDDGKKEVWNSEFKYDPKNNWIEKISFKNNKPLRIVKRNIEYYE